MAPRHNAMRHSARMPVSSILVVPRLLLSPSPVAVAVRSTVMTGGSDRPATTYVGSVLIYII